MPAATTIRKALIRVACVLGACLALAVFCFVFRAPLLTTLANAWVINDPLHKADAIVILGGGLDSRPFGAAELYKQGLASRIIYMDVKFEPERRLGLGRSEPELTRQILLKSGVPESALTLIGRRVTSTQEEAGALRGLMQTSNVRNLIIATDLFHTRRVRWLLHKQLKPWQPQIQLTPVYNPHYQLTNWWQHEEGLIAFQNEVVKMGYYWIKY